MGSKKTTGRVIEKFCWHKYELFGEKPSKINANETVRKAYGWGCPKCGHVNTPTIHHFGTAECRNCDLTATVHGNCMECCATPNEKLRSQS